MSRPTPYKRCKAVEDKIIKRICEGASFTDAPRLEGIDEATFRRWRQCENENNDATLSLRDRRCWVCANCTLQRKCDEAESHFKNECVRTVFVAGELHWKARAWILERRYRQEYGVSAVIETKQDTPPIDPTAALIGFITRGTKAHRSQSVRRP